MRKTIGWRDLFRFPELLLLLVLPVMHFGAGTVIMTGSWLLHVWLREDTLRFPSFGSWLHVLVTIGSWLLMAFAGLVMAAQQGRVVDDHSLGGLLAELLGSFMVLGVIAVPAFLGVVGFSVAQILFWIMGIRQLWRRRKMGVK